jgi:FMN phosphatase YigB (HAD superfamily)
MELIIMRGFHGVALDIGGVIYFDEPFELAWLQGTFERMVTREPTYTLGMFLDGVERWYREGSPGYSFGHPSSAALAEDSWAAVRRAWTELAQEVPGAVRAAQAIAGNIPTVVVANQPPECMRVLRDWGLTRSLRGVFLDSLCGVAKPDPRLLDLGRERLGLPAAELLMVGNRTDHDVLPARELGCGAVFVRAASGCRPPPGVHPDIIRLHQRHYAIKTAPPGGPATVVTIAGLAELAPSAWRASADATLYLSREIYVPGSR